MIYFKTDTHFLQDGIHLVLYPLTLKIVKVISKGTAAQQCSAFLFFTCAELKPYTLIGT